MNEIDPLVEQAEQLFRERKLEEAFHYYNEAGLAYREVKESQKAAHCFAQAAQCEKIRTGFEPLLEAAHLSEMAAIESLKVKDYAFARWQFREAALLYEREGDFEKYSRCFIESQDAFLEYLWYVVVSGKKQDRLKKTITQASWIERFMAFGDALLGVISKTLWGYGEQPFRAVMAGFFIMLGCALIYTYGGLLNLNGTLRQAHFPEALYFSGITFSTLGYGDITPFGWLRFVAVLESLSGFLMGPLLVVALTRRYLRVYR